MSVPIMIAVAAGAIIIGAPVLVASQAALADTRAAVAADASALAAAEAALGFIAADPCALAAELAARHQAELADCAIDPTNGNARVTARVRLGPFVALRAAHAGQPIVAAGDPLGEYG